MNKTFRTFLAGCLILAIVVLVGGEARAVPVVGAARAISTVVTPPLPSGVSAGYAVFDRQSGISTGWNEHVQFRSASVVKLLIALDTLLGTAGHQPSIEDARGIERMLRRSDDKAATDLWSEHGKGAIVGRMTKKLDLRDTAPPVDENVWGYTAMSAADTVTIYKAILDSVPDRVEQIIMGNLRLSARCGADGFNQSFGIPSAYRDPWAVKQGWSGFGPKDTCPPLIGQDGSGFAPDRAAATGPDLTRRAMHTTGVVGAGDRSIVAIFTLHPVDTPYDTAAATVTKLARWLEVPGAVVISGVWFGTFGGPWVHTDPTTAAATRVRALDEGEDVLVTCQRRGEKVDTGLRASEWWAYLLQLNGYVTTLYVDTAELVPGEKLPGIPVC